MSASHEHHTGPVKTPKQMLWLSIFVFVVPIFVIIGLVLYVTSAVKPANLAQGDSVSIAGLTQADLEHDTLANIQKVGTVEIKDANRALKTGEEVYHAQCVACHAAGVAGAPKFGDAGAWGPRLGQGYEALLHSALKGKNAMGAQGGGEFEDLEIGRAVVYMANAGGGKFDVPQPPAADAPAAEASTAM